MTPSQSFHFGRYQVQPTPNWLGNLYNALIEQVLNLVSMTKEHLLRTASIKFHFKELSGGTQIYGRKPCSEAEP